MKSERSKNQVQSLPLNISALEENTLSFQPYHQLIIYVIVIVRIFWMKLTGRETQPVYLRRAHFLAPRTGTQERKVSIRKDRIQGLDPPQGCQFIFCVLYVGFVSSVAGLAP